MKSIDLTGLQVVALRDVETAAKQGATELLVCSRGILTPSARDLIQRSGLVLRKAEKPAAVCNGCGSIWDKKMSAPVASFAPNAFGLYDTAGNAWSWMADCWNKNYDGAPSDGSARLTGDCGTRTVRGAGWGTHEVILRAARRVGDAAPGRHGSVGFRVALTL